MVHHHVAGRVEEDGKVAYMNYQPVDMTVEVHGRKYHFALQRNVALAWVLLEDEAGINEIIKVCCGGHRRRRFILANENQVQIWKGTYRQ